MDDFSAPTHLAPATVPTPEPFELPPQRVHPAWIIISAIRQLRAFAVPLVIALVLQRGDRQLVFLAITSGVAAIGIIGQYISWLNMHYEVTGGELRFRSGLVNRRERSVPIERIQSVDTSEDVLQRLFRVVQVTVETAAGGAGTDVKLEALSRSESSTLIARLDAARARRPTPADAANAATTAATSSSPASAPSPALASASASQTLGESILIRRISARDLLLGAATSGRVGPALAIIAAGWQFADDVLGDDIWERLALQAAHTTVQGIAAIAVIVAVIAWLMAFISTLLTFGGFELRRQDDRLIIRHGLLDRRQSTVPIARIQAIEVAEPFLRQPFRLASVRFESAGYGKDTAESGVLFPVLPLTEVSALIDRCSSGFAVDSTVLRGMGLHPLPDRARRRYVLPEIVALAMVVAVFVAAAALIPRFDWWWGLLPLLALPLAALYGDLQFRGAGWIIDEQDRLVLRRRTLTKRTTVVPRRRIQRRITRQNLFQRRADLASFTATIASGGQGGLVSLRHLDAAVAADLVARLGPRRSQLPPRLSPSTAEASNQDQD